jgi:poly-beta-1,6-N-acetyl-D-glucosamine N-deacetylase
VVRALLARIVLGFAALAVVAVPVGVYQVAHAGFLRGPQSEAPTITLDPIQAQEALALAKSPARGVVVLGYRDIASSIAGARGLGPRTLTVRNLETEIMALRAAGFACLLPQDLTAAYLGERPLPARGIVVTFDKSSNRLWTAIDPILQKTGCRATVFVHPTEVPASGHEQLDWARLQAMSSSGRWSVQATMPNSGMTVVIGADGARGPALLMRAWLPRAGRLETPAERCQRIQGVAQNEDAALKAHNLPTATVFNLPFSVGYPFGRLPGALQELTDCFKPVAQFSLLSDSLHQALDQQALRSRQLRRLDVFGSSTASELLSRLSDVMKVANMPGGDTYAGVKGS